ncbi:response regulator transcription factor [Mariprofundus erugo]|uniref:response regulator transcription factor n=1 Tax=Mariprofundus erugo TaxID=2528639 RepID=UPI0010FF1C8D|nr:response regulator transcription factor [Mariprofundus erugo]TLS76912.1 response regulator transcription factor [Mariprofundus erugo]
MILSQHRLVSEAIGSAVSSIHSKRLLHQCTNMELALIGIKQKPPELIITDYFIGQSTAHILLKYMERHMIKVPTIIYTDSQIGLKALISRHHVSLVHKNSSIKELLRAIDVTLNNRTYIDSTIAYELLKPNSSEPSIDLLSEREVEVLNCYLNGLKPIEISEKLHISTKTVRAHKANIMEKLQLNSDIELAHFGITHHII